MDFPARHSAGRSPKHKDGAVTNLLPFPNNRLEKEEAGQWLARVDRGLTPDEQDALSEWLREPRRREMLFRLARDWDSMAVLEELAALFPLREEMSLSGWHAGRIAAAVLLVGVIAGGLVYIGAHGRMRSAPQVAAHRNEAPLEASFTADYSTSVGQRLTVKLPDHSEARLNTNTQLHVEYSATARLLTMSQGEAIYEVAKDPSRVFTVRAAGFDFNALGTVFNVRADRQDSLRLTVTEGRVQVHRTPPAQIAPGLAHDVPPTAVSDATDVVVEANNAVSIGSHGERIDVLTPEQVADATAWQRGVISFEATPLEQVISELARYSTVRFVISDPKVARLRVSGYFEVDDTDNLVAALEQDVGIKITKHNGYLLLSMPPATQ
jgi:transmembrane sensor